MTKVTTLLVSIFILPLSLFGQFGSNKCDVKVQRLVPPPTRIQGPIRVVVRQWRDPAISSQLQNQLESSIIRYEPGLTISQATPQTEVEAEISEYVESLNWENRQEQQFQKTGTKQVLNTKTNTYQSQDVYGMAPVTKRYLVVKGNMKVTWKAVTATKQVVASDVASANFSNSFLEGNKAPDVSGLRTTLSGNVIAGIAGRLVPYPETIEVFVAKGPGGKLEGGCKFAESGQWTRALESWETVPKFKDPKDEAYRLYNIGLAHEVLAYTAGFSRDYEGALNDLSKAAENYGLAVDQNSGEKYFREPQGRIKTSLSYYTALKDQSGGARPIQGSSTTANSAGGNAAPAPSANALTNDGIIEFVRNGFSEAFVLDQIRTSAHPAFSMAPADLIKLKQAGVSERIITEMLQRK